MSKLRPPARLFMSQYGDCFYAWTVKELRSQIGNGGSRVGLLYQDKPDGSTVRCGYVIGQHWLREFVAVERPA